MTAVTDGNHGNDGKEHDPPSRGIDRDSVCTCSRDKQAVNEDREDRHEEEFNTGRKANTEDVPDGLPVPRKCLVGDRNVGVSLDEEPVKKYARDHYERDDHPPRGPGNAHTCRIDEERVEHHVQDRGGAHDIHCPFRISFCPEDRVGDIGEEKEDHSQKDDLPVLSSKPGSLSRPEKADDRAGEEDQGDGEDRRQDKDEQESVDRCIISTGLVLCTDAAGDDGGHTSSQPVA